MILACGTAEQSHSIVESTPIAPLLFPPFGRVPFSRHSARSEAETRNPFIANATPIALMFFPPCRACAFLLLAQKKGTKEKGTRVSGGCAVPSPARRAAGGA